MKIISDTTALIILAKSTHLDFLTNFIETKEVSNHEILSDIRATNLNLGETEAITLALELELRLIIDEKTGRKIATQKGVKIIGLLGILEANYKLDFISYRELLYILEDFKRVDYRLSSQLEKMFLDGLKRE